MYFSSIIEYNKYLIDNNYNIKLIDYIKYAGTYIYNQEINNKDLFLKLLIDEEHIIHQK